MSQTIQAFSAALATLTDQWIHIMPSGLFIGFDGRGPYEMRDADAVISASKRKTVDLVIDRDHETVFTSAFKRNCPAQTYGHSPAGWGLVF